MPPSEGQAHHRPARYRLVVRGELGDHFVGAFPGVRVHAEGKRTMLVVDVGDQPQLHLLLDRLCNLGIELISLVREAEVPARLEAPLGC
jgi:hypothetical protein